MIVEIGSFDDAYDSALAAAHSGVIANDWDVVNRDGRWWKDGERFTGWTKKAGGIFHHYIGGIYESDVLLPCLIWKDCSLWNRGDSWPHWPHGPSQLYADGGTSWALYGKRLSLSEYLDQVDLPMEEKVMLKLRWG